MSKPTMRRDGARYVTLRVRQDLSLTELAHIFWAAAMGGYYGRVEHKGFPRNSAEVVRGAVLKYMQWNGISTRTCEDEEFTGSAEAQRWAFEHVARAYGFDESEIPEPDIDEAAARHLAAGRACEDSDD
jgi:hypothetical protein